MTWPRALCAALACASACLTIVLAQPRASHGQAPALQTVGVWLHVAQDADAQVDRAAFAADQLAHANTVFEGLGLRLVQAGSSQIPARHAKLVTRGDRDALAPYVKRGVVNCMLVSTLMDVDEPGRERRGVHWHGPGGKHWVIVSTISGPYVLAHELAHFFGNPRHSDTPGNLLSYTRTEAVPFLDAPQVARVQRAVARMVRTGELRAE